MTEVRVTVKPPGFATLARGGLMELAETVSTTVSIKVAASVTVMD